MQSERPKGACRSPRGIVSGYRTVDGLEYLQTDAAINSGNLRRPACSRRRCRGRSCRQPVFQPQKASAWPSRPTKSKRSSITRGPQPGTKTQTATRHEGTLNKAQRSIDRPRSPAPPSDLPRRSRLPVVSAPPQEAPTSTRHRDHSRRPLAHINETSSRYGEKPQPKERAEPCLRSRSVVTDATGRKQQSVSVPSDAPTIRLIAKLRRSDESAALPGPDGQPLSYKFHHRSSGRQLRDEQTLQDAGVAPGDLLRLIAEITAG